ncbi:dipeptidyl peptidase IV N-terminal region-domain-containing protein [Radiomyces spectabilis]|uniref:dipeptidyl peptidase IV N-terminal region-domain-containing protein n=1 Tax=Radiomyces spectabilis TaxID=64574 RepID=UPI00221F574D|nr:dipeptidyl peptidase IV N-terminal region-domain-containing protein [Radiomyces spectabilis]KAI8380933.1 dipeptidyl peptidase IV N-terminal region-domain-containing protein [Radiomyces spectabilis]
MSVYRFIRRMARYTFLVRHKSYAAKMTPSNEHHAAEKNDYLEDDAVSTSSQPLLHYQIGDKHHTIPDPDFPGNFSANLEDGQDPRLIKRNNKKRLNWICLALTAAMLLATWATWTIALCRDSSSSRKRDTVSKLRRITFDDIYNSTFTPKRQSLVWVRNDPRDGIFTFRDQTTNDILLESIEDGSTQVFVKASDLRIGDKQLEVESFEISGDAKYLMLWTNVTQQFRHSSFSNIYIYTLDDHSIFPLTEQSTVDIEPKISYAEWSPKGHQIAYVMENDLYVTDLATHRRVTFDGSKTVFNGVPDWVYEEEVFASDHTLWWSPDATHLAFLRFNETAVHEYHLPYYTMSNDSYPEELKIKYPKAGTPNPLVSLHLYSLSADTTVMVTKNETNNAMLQAVGRYADFADDDRLITDVAWATDTHTHLLFKQTNRVQDHEVTSLVTLSSNLRDSTVQITREYKPKDSGWIDVGQSMVFLAHEDDQESVRYLDIADNADGYLHLAIFTAGKSASEPLWLTTGEWEVVAGTVVTDKERQLIHYMSTERSPSERHLYTISLDHTDPASTKICQTCPNDPERHAYYSVSFSPKAGYYKLDYQGPNIPTTVVRKVEDPKFEAVLQDNRALADLLKAYELPQRRMLTVTGGGVEMLAMELLPPNFDASKKYPVLFHVYGGPGSQLVSHEFELSWHTFVASQLEYIIVTVDGRGTGYRGRAYRESVRGRLGKLETIDQVNAARHWANLPYVDASRMAIWGWSYGGYMTTKVIEANDGVFSLGMAVAPVTDWRFYDTVYTERYMLTPQLNAEGYANSAVTNMTGFNNAHYLLIHGTGDDNG